MDDVAKLLDFGLVRPAATAGAAHLSGEGQILGTPLFMSPEQAMGGRELDERSDIYSLGAVAYYLLTGRPPFDGEGGIAVMIAHARDPVVPPSQVRPGIPEAPGARRAALPGQGPRPSDSRTPRAWSEPWPTALRRRLGPAVRRPVVAGFRPASADASERQLGRSGIVEGGFAVAAVWRNI